jgi:hypothetical protein
MASLPIPANTTCDIYRAGVPITMPPAVSGVKIFLNPEFAKDHEKAIASGTMFRWTHTALMPLGTDVRDGDTTSPSGVSTNTQYDSVYVPDKSGTQFNVIFVERINRGTSADCFRAYLLRQPPTWPTNNL